MDRKLIEKSSEIAEEIDASALIVIPGEKEIEGLLEEKEYSFPIFIVTSPEKKYSGTHEEFKISARGETQNFAKQFQDAVMMAYVKGKVDVGDKIVGVGAIEDEATGILVYNVYEDPLLRSIHESTGRVGIDTMRAILDLAVEIGREGREGKAIGTAFVVGDSSEVMSRSHQLILNPYKCQDDEVRDVKNHQNWETIKEFSQIDGVFILDEDGKILSAGRYLSVDSDEIDIPSGLGARHVACASVSKETDAIVVSVAKSGGVVRMFKDGEIIGEVEPRVRILPV
ncbi:MAG: Diadenylate cyclase (c-di-AMP synthetase), DisA-N domain [Candidatus Methanohalarchaeum thermophilum]|uniref:Diadenylate cyclase n=1 Tax=Methanohalarchaeum thermophilum TaxID=1903181 RepID=A0A1Q6DXG0_METT1|nr:MAG: Diadenylate cyclase (c-di-AMP synthetase), DisA-N domain [Candidatus Methanohalarchaeum thermophilum]